MRRKHSSGSGASGEEPKAVVNREVGDGGVGKRWTREVGAPHKSRFWQVGSTGGESTAVGESEEGKSVWGGLGSSRGGVALVEAEASADQGGQDGGWSGGVR